MTITRSIFLVLIALAAFVGCADNPTVPEAADKRQLQYLPGQPYPYIPCDRAQDVIDSAQQLANLGAVPQSTVNFLKINSKKLCNNDTFYRDAVTGVSWQFNPAKGGGSVDGGTWTVHNIFGGQVGSGQLHIVTDAGGNITGHTASGGVLLGEVDSEQIGDTWEETCPDGSTVECGSFQLEFSQGYSWLIENILKTPTEDICADCPVSP